MTTKNEQENILDTLIGPWQKLATSTGLNTLFLRKGRDTPDRSADILTSPVDCKVKRIAPIGNDGMIEEKSLFGKPRFLALEDHLGGSHFLNDFTGGDYINLYLAPWFLHYILFPIAGKIVEARYVPGKCLPLIFCRSGEVVNEKLVSIIETKHGFPMAMLMIGSFLVCGLHMDAAMSEDHQKGDRFGCFKLGSTVVMAFPPNTVDFICAEGERLAPGQALARIR